ncbi:sigma-54-dependent Fis family transcriptional regulator [Methylobacterium terrae]|uniref:Sigma-54-dependent Fis family transcriptional regulator n=1 Tax=Methylobacterium terrae TaxID=2202827 RepID=A0A2U8WIU3_9HYPH|nr:sigma-54-dependent Fis family transcriptional regulator [Methylobacterium terrae]AWN45182.1 sigma-54-dependent Fis family transcriptional regulator [Methylobacterium terrae]
MQSRVTTPRTLLAARRQAFGPGAAEPPPPILRSWERCAALGLDFGQRPRVEPLTAAAMREAFDRNEVLRQRCRPEIEALHGEARATGSLVILTDADGLILDTLGSDAFAGRAAQVSLRPGVPWNESLTGTNAIGTALIERRPVEVRGPEHYFEPHRILSCAAMPILGPDGTVLGVLDLTGPAAIHQGHALGLVGLAVAAIEHRLFEAVPPGCEVLRLHRDVNLLGTSREGVLVFEGRRLVGANRHGLALLGLSWSDLGAEHAAGHGGSLAPGPLSLRDEAGAPLYGRLQNAPATVRRRLPVEPGRPDLPEPVAAIPVAPRREAPILDAATEKLLARAVRLIDAGIPVVVEGETGTGKEVFARAAHVACARAQRPFVAVNCAALPETLIEAELFGYEPGAFTGAARHGAKGLLRQAEGGLLFLDEIGDMPLSLQSRLLRALQEREVLPVGGTRPVPVDFALICATHRDLSRMVEDGAFRADLFYRIAPYRVRLPTLRERPDRLALVRGLWARTDAPARGVSLSPPCEAALAEASWPGNLRQLAACLRALAALAEPGEVLGPEDLPEGLAARPAPAPAARPAPAAGRLDALAEEAMRAALAAHGGNVSRAARSLGISRSTLYRRCLGERAGASSGGTR